MLGVHSPRMWILLAAVFSIILTIPASAQQSSVTLPPELARVLTDYESAWRRGDGAALASLFSDDGFVLPNGAPAVRGRDAIQKYYKGPGGPLVLRAFSFATEGSVGYIIGGFSRQSGEPDVGKFTLTLRKDRSGRWLIVSDMDNGNRRPLCSTEPASIGEAVQRLMASDNARDLAGVLSGYTDDVIWYPPGEKMLSGKDAIRSRYAALFSTFTLNLSSQIAEARGEGNIGFVRGFTAGTLRPTVGGDPVAINDTFVALVRCEGGMWRVSHLIWNHQPK
jgi:ketosteroid isomerase-like protein